MGISFLGFITEPECMALSLSSAVRLPEFSVLRVPHQENDGIDSQLYSCTYFVSGHFLSALHVYLLI